MPRLLIIEDDEDLRRALKMSLRQQGYQVETAGTGPKGLKKARAQGYDLIILDLMLPGLDGLSLVRALRQTSQTPVLILTARSSEIDKIIGLESGADDYLTKPFSLGELVARIRALLRRTRTAAPAAPERLISGDLTLDLITRRVTLCGQRLDLSPKEFSLLAELMRNEGAVLSRDLLLTRVWGYDYAGNTRTVDVHIHWLREKIEADPAHPRYLQTVRGIGYRFEGPVVGTEDGNARVACDE
ncbi:MAG TPA: response regulator transcription factor [Anaerolineae bacterium]|nr:response regulator transcription factor [Anaerolineae bacterium]